MMNLNIGEIKKMFPNNTLKYDDALSLMGVNRDSRIIKKGEVYVAIKGKNFDGHEFVGQAFENGAIGAIVDREIDGLSNLIVVDDVIQALASLATYYRKKFRQPVIAVTGSNGKTTTKDFLKRVLEEQCSVIATKGNLNNHIGVPITIFSFSDDADYFIVEMGMNHFEEIRHLTKIALPNIALITSIGRAHFEGVEGTIEGVAQAKGELFEELGPNDVAFVYLDDPYISKMKTRAKTITFGFTNHSDVWADGIAMNEDGSCFKLHHGTKTFDVKIQMVGRQHIQNALSVYAIASYLGIEDKKILRGLEGFQIAINRGRKLRIQDLTIIDDTYNANPDSMKLTIQSLCDAYPDRYKIVALGGMLELGRQAPDFHEAIGVFCKQSGIDEIFAYGNNADRYLSGFGYDQEEGHKRFFADHKSLAASLVKFEGRKDVVLLLKGSRGMTMERVLEYLSFDLGSGLK